MPSGTTNLSEREIRFGEIAFAYLRERQDGRRADPQEWLNRYPEFRTELASFFADQEEVDRLGAPLREIAQAAARPHTEGPEPGVLGDFRIVRELGRGGMGVVYEAEQISLGRRVALKVLTFAATMDARQLQRFQNEARAAAGLHHTNIVPVYFVGCERGVHYYAMQFIEGRDLASALTQIRAQAGYKDSDLRSAETVDVPASQPAAAAATATQPIAGLSTERSTKLPEYFRSVARLGIQAAEALDYAHQMGIVHRDVKPANLIVDAAGRLWVTDFGLAQIQSDARMTMTGDLIGTLRYMSPEQALAKRVVIDHRTDVYSLGATLYELVTLAPAFNGGDRQELLRQIAFEEPKPPRRINRAVPAELATIVIKAMEKNPADRYASAQELADDLRRFLMNEPIRARRPSWRLLAAKWARRHQPVVWSAAVVLLVVAVLVGGVGLWSAQHRAQAQGEARAALQEATKFQKEERWPEALSAIRRAKGALAGVGADQGLQEQVDELGKDLEMVRRLEEARLEGARDKDGRFDFEASSAAFAAAFAWYGLAVETLDAQEVGERIRSRSIRMQMAAALDEWANVCRELKVKGWTQLLAVARVADPDPWRDRLRDALERKDPKALDALAADAGADELPPATAVLLSKLTKWTAAAEGALVVLRQAQQRHPADFWVNEELGECHYNLQPPRLEETIRYWTAAVALRPQSPGAHLNLGVALGDKGLLDEAIVEYRIAIRLKNDHAVAHGNLGNALSHKGLLDEAIAECREAIRFKRDYAAAHHNLGTALAGTGRLDEAIAEYREAIRLNKDDAATHYNLANALRDKDQLDEAIVEYRAAIRLKKDNADAHCNLAVALAGKGQLDEAIAEFREAIRLKKDDANAHNNLGNALRDKGLMARD